jgi:hypothetical protein
MLSAKLIEDVVRPDEDGLLNRMESREGKDIFAP